MRKARPIRNQLVTRIDTTVFGLVMVVTIVTLLIIEMLLFAPKFHG